MSDRRLFIPIIVALSLALLACRYIVLPEGLEESSSSGSKGWTAVATGVGKSETGDLRIQLTLRNQTGDWSTMKAVEGKPAVLSSGGKSTDCDSSFVGTGGHRLAPGFQVQGYMTGSKAEPKIQMIYLDCKGVEAAPGAKLSIDYVSYSGPLDYYHQENGEVDGTIVVNLDEIASDLKYPIYEPVEGVVQKPDVRITAISDNIISLLGVQRTDKGLEFKWQNENPTEFALKTHIGNPPVIGEDGIIYGIFEIMDLASVPLTPAGGKVNWTTEVAVPPEVKGFYILLSVESKQMRLYVNYALDITSQ